MAARSSVLLQLGERNLRRREWQTSLREISRAALAPWRPIRAHHGCLAREALRPNAFLRWRPCLHSSRLAKSIILSLLNTHTLLRLHRSRASLARDAVLVAAKPNWIPVE